MLSYEACKPKNRGAQILSVEPLSPKDADEN